MRWLPLLLLLACADKDDAPVGDSDPVETDVDACATFEGYACTGAGKVCVANCDQRIEIRCNILDCTLMGEGQGAGRSCRITQGDFEDGCGLCETAFLECL